jgi:predicted nuclease with TOPRIM domain
MTIVVGIAVLWKSSETQPDQTKILSRFSGTQVAGQRELNEVPAHSNQKESSLTVSEDMVEETADSEGLQDADLTSLRGDVYKRFDEILNEYEQRLPKISAQQALKEIPDLRNRLKRHRDSFPLQSDLDDGSMRRIEETLELLPESSTFDKSNCRNYKLEILAQFDPKAPNEIPTHPSVRRVFNILELICKK